MKNKVIRKEQKKLRGKIYEMHGKSSRRSKTIVRNLKKVQED